MNWQKIKEKILEHIVTVVLSLVSFLCLVIWQAVPSQSWEQLGAAIPKRALAALLALLLIALATTIAYSVSLRRKLKALPNQPPPKLYTMFNVMWDGQSNPLCPLCQVLLSYSIVDEGEDKPIHFLLTCPKCKTIYELMDVYGHCKPLFMAKVELRQKYPELPDPHL